MTFGENLKYLRKQRGLKQEHLAEVMELKSLQAIGHYETGRVIPPADKLIKLSEYFNVPANDLWSKDLRNAG